MNTFLDQILSEHRLNHCILWCLTIIWFLIQIIKKNKQKTAVFCNTNLWHTGFMRVWVSLFFFFFYINRSEVSTHSAFIPTFDNRVLFLSVLWTWHPVSPSPTRRKCHLLLVFVWVRWHSLQQEVDQITWVSLWSTFLVFLMYLSYLRWDLVWWSSCLLRCSFMNFHLTQNGDKVVLYTKNSCQSSWQLNVEVVTWHETKGITPLHVSVLCVLTQIPIYVYLIMCNSHTALISHLWGSLYPF